jgi:anti-anti-sigma factor
MPVPPPFIAVVEPVGEHVRVALAGELDLATVAEAEEAIARARRDTPGPLRLDLSEVTFLDSSGLRMVMELDAACRADGCRFSIAPGPRSVQRVFEVAGVLDILPFAPR